MTDTICQCRKCGGHLCYQVHQEQVVDWRCLSCGFQTNTFLLAGTEGVKVFEESIPQLYKDIKFQDEDGFVWYPLHLSKEGVGMIIADGTGKDNWYWSFFPHILVEAHESERFKGAKYKINSREALQFPQDKFALALQACKLI